MSRKHNEPDDLSNIIFGCIVVVSVGLIILLYFLAFAANAQAADEETSYCIIGLQPYSFEWVDTLPYQEVRNLKWDTKLGFPELHEAVHLLYTVIEGDCPTITQVFAHGEDTFAMSFMDRDSEDGHPHPIKAVWVDE